VTGASGGNSPALRLNCVGNHDREIHMRSPILKILSRVALTLSAAMYVLCFTQIGICISGDCGRWSPSSMLMLGFIQFFDAFSFGAGVAWLANPMLYLAWILVLKANTRRAFLF
jgi:hypothetical protein